MFLGYNTNGLAHHAFPDAVDVLARWGYRAVGITLDHDLLRREGEVFTFRTPPEAMAELLEKHAFRSVVETGARFLLDPFGKHSPNLLHPDPQKRRLRQNYYRAAVTLASVLRSDGVSLWSGAAESDEPEETLFSRLATELRELLDFAGEQGVSVMFEPEPGMLVDTLARFDRLLDALGDAAARLALTLDTGHLYCQREPFRENILRYRDRLRNVHLDDAVRDLHEHRRFGEGEISFAEIFDALREIGYAGGVYVELSRHSAAGVETARDAMAFLKNFRFP
ncbi:MAG: sugar phosphate isomerase/epimerase [Planctomycetia bacterium]|nr:sugar phosphate isomerase/epimerase [Planctomycetia bacterium]